jgi:type I restriction enzyme M protein
LRANDYNLNIPRYVDSSEDAESWDIYASMFGGIPHTEIDQLVNYWEAFPALRADLFTDISAHCAKLTIEHVKNSIREHADIVYFKRAFAGAFETFPQLLKAELLDNMMNLSIANEEEVLSNDIFSRLINVPLIDKYWGFQLLWDEWQTISGDLEMLQTEGFEAARQVDPNMVIKKKDGKETEVQEGWIGHIMPFDLVQSTLLKEELEALKTKENRQAEITAEYAELLDSLSEEEKEGDTVNDAKDSFVAAAVAKEAKQIQAGLKKNEKPDLESYQAKILKVADLIVEEKALKAQIKTDTEKLHLLTKKTI